MSRIGIIKKLLAFSLALTTAFTVVAGGRVNLIEDENVVATSSEAKENAEAIEQAEKDIEDLKSQQKDLDAKIEAAQKDIATEKEAQTHINEQISAYNVLIADKQDELDNAEARYQELNENTKDRIRAMEEDGSLSYWEVLFKANSFSDLLDRMNMVEEIASSDKKRLKALGDAAENVEEAQEELEMEKAELEVTKTELDATQIELDAKREADAAKVLEKDAALQ